MMSASTLFFDPDDIRPALQGMAPTKIRSKNVCLSPTDWQAFGDALMSAYPAGRYVRAMTIEELKSESPTAPESLFANHLCAFNAEENGPPWEIQFVLDPKWELKIEPYELGWSRWRENLVDYPHVQFRPGWQSLVPSREPEPVHLRGGRIDVYCGRDDKAHLAFARRFFRLFSKFATNENQILMKYPGYEITDSVEKGSDIWLGHDAIRWAREDKSRLLNYKSGWGYRPNDEGIVKPPSG